MCTHACAEPYEVKLKDKAFADDPCHPTRWTGAENVTAGQLHEYWASQEAAGYVAMKSALAAVTPGQVPHDLCTLKGSLTVVHFVALCNITQRQIAIIGTTQQALRGAPTSRPKMSLLVQKSHLPVLEFPTSKVQCFIVYNDSLSLLHEHTKVDC